MRYCSNCGEPVEPAGRFCSGCGHALGSAAPALDSRQFDVEQRPPASRAWVAGVVAVVVAVVAAAGGGYVLLRHKQPTRRPDPVAAQTSTRAGTRPTQAAAQHASFADLYRSDASGVVKIVASTCGGTGIGTGFLLPSGMVATVAHVVTGAVSVGISTYGRTTAATVVGYDPAQDMALLRPAEPILGHRFHFAGTGPNVGDPVAAVGYPLDQPETLTAGTVSGLNRTITVAGSRRTGMIETDTPINPGNSGGPLIAANGRVVGLVDALETDANGIGYAVNGHRAAAELASWQAAPVRQSPGTCTDAVGPAHGVPTVGAPASGPDVAGIIRTLSAYFAAVNTADYTAVCAQLTPTNAGSNCVARAASGDATSYDFGFDLLSITQVSPGVDVANLDFTSLQDPSDGPNGDMCDNWTLAYHMVESNGTWLIAEALPQNGSSHTSC